MKAGKIPSFAEVEKQIKENNKDRNMSIISGVKVTVPDLAVYDALLQNADYNANHGGMVI